MCGPWKQKVEIKLLNKTELGFLSQLASVIVMHGHPLARFSALRINCFLLPAHLISQRTRHTRQTKVSQGFLSSIHPSIFPLTLTRFSAKSQTHYRDDLQHLKQHKLQWRCRCSAPPNVKSSQSQRKPLLKQLSHLRTQKCNWNEFRPGLHIEVQHDYSSEGNDFSFWQCSSSVHPYCSY